MLRIILKFGRVGSLLGANYRLADCKERWQDFLKELKVTGDTTVGDSDSDWTSGSEEESDLGRGMCLHQVSNHSGEANEHMTGLVTRFPVQLMIRTARLAELPVQNPWFPARPRRGFEPRGCSFFSR